VLEASGFSGSEVNALVLVEDGVVIAGAASNYVAVYKRKRAAAAWNVSAEGKALTDFGVDGVWLSAPDAAEDLAFTLALGPDGSLYVAGEGPRVATPEGGTPELYTRVWRISGKGERDASYGGTNTGYANLVLESIKYESREQPAQQSGPWFGSAQALAFDAEGRLLVGAALNGFGSFDAPAIFRVTDAGELDTGFNDQGVAINRSGFQGVSVGALFVGGDGAMYLVGENQTAMVWKFAPNGKPVAEYGGHNTTNPPFYGISFVGFDEITRNGVTWRDGALDTMARVTATGWSLPENYPGEPTREYRLTLARIGPDGLVDRSYASTGSYVESTYSQGYALSTGPTGVVYVCGVRETTTDGTARDAATVWAFTSDGAPLESFGSGGLLVLPPLPDATGPATCHDLAITHDGYLYLAGTYLAATADDPERPLAFVTRVK
jgi:hypothetical protein